jgi:2,3-dihydroxyphenylpropionate 1,2-dioxygenase
VVSDDRSAADPRGTGGRPSRLVVAASHSPSLGAAFGVVVHEPLRDALDAARAVVRAFDPELVVFFGPDHRRAFRAVVPSFAIALTATSRGDRGAPTGRFDVPTELARDLAAAVLNQGVDVAVAHRVALDHGFGLTAVDLLGDIAAVPTIPIFVNSVSPPLPGYPRAAALGRAVGAALADRPERILFVGSGGLAHHLPGFTVADDGVEREEAELVAFYTRLNRELADPDLVLGPEWDQALLAGLANLPEPGAAGWLDDIGRDPVGRAGNGANEALTWVAAWAAGGGPLTTLGYDFTRELSPGSGAAVVASSWAVQAGRAVPAAADTAGRP